jgi:hypothetical protein
LRLLSDEGGWIDFEIVDLGDVSSGKTIQSLEMAGFFFNVS